MSVTSFSIKMLALGLFFSSIAAMSFAQISPDAKPIQYWDQSHDRVWLGGEVWANPMEDWHIVDGWAQCKTSASERNIHSLTHQILDGTKGFEISVELQANPDLKAPNGGGMRVGVKTEINEYRSNCFAKGGINAGISSGKLILGKKEGNKLTIQDSSAVTLHLRAEAKEEGKNSVSLTLTAFSMSNEKLGDLSIQVAAKDVLGNIALVSQYAGLPKRDDKAGYKFRNWQVSGEGFSEQPGQRFGPILWSMYSLSDSRTEEGFVLKMSALTGPMGRQDNQEVELEIKDAQGNWQSLGEEKLDEDAWTATFRIANWKETRDTPYRLLYRESQKSGKKKTDSWEGTILANPAGRPLRMAALTCQNDYAFPYEPVANNVVALKPDLLYFSGDQLYESHGGFGIIREPAAPAILNYLRKFHQFGWAFREAMRNAPTICLPDDHDVFQGNIWGEGGRAMKSLESGASSKGGYREPMRMVNAVHKTNCGHHPDFYDPSPVEQGISVYYGDMVYGDVSFAILGDRQFKSGPEHVETGSGRADHVMDPDFDTSQLDKPGLVLLGKRQEDFLKEWGKDWRGHSMKVVLSQTVFAGVATHHGRKKGYLKADLDSGGWPQTARNRAIDIIRDSMALHINGDQHLASLSQYGVKTQRDSNWSFCTPAIAAGYPRSWLPDEIGMPHQNRPKHGLANTGEYLDGLGNRVYVYAIGNPIDGKDPNRYKKAHEKGSGFGFVTIDPKAKTYELDSFRFLIDATDGNPENQFPGWPVTIHQKENRGENVIE